MQQRSSKQHLELFGRIDFKSYLIPLSTKKTTYFIAKVPPRRKMAAPSWQGRKWQVKLAGQWKDFADDEDDQIKAAYEAGAQQCKYSKRGQQYQVDRQQKTQQNTSTAPYKTRPIRHPVLHARGPWGVTRSSILCRAFLIFAHLTVWPLW